MSSIPHDEMTRVDEDSDLEIVTSREHRVCSSYQLVCTRLIVPQSCLSSVVLFRAVLMHAESRDPEVKSTIGRKCIL